MRDLHKWKQKNILHVEGSAFVNGVYTPYGSLVTMESFHIVILTGFLQFNNTNLAIKNLIIAASAGSYLAMHNLQTAFED